MKKNVIFTVMFMIAITAIFAAGGRDARAAADGRTTITVQKGSWWAERAPGLIEEFERTFPQYALNIELLPIAGYFDNAAIAILAGTAPTVLDIDASQIPTFADRNLLRDLTQIVGNRVREEDFVPSSWNSSHFNGRMYGMPNRATAGVLYYNITMFEAAGVPLPAGAMSLAEYLDLAQRLTIPGQQYGAGISACPSDPLTVFTSFSPILWAKGGDFLSADGRVALLNTPEAVAAIAYWTDLYTRYNVVPEGSANFTTTRDVAPLFEQNRVAMVIHGHAGVEHFGRNPNIRFGATQVPGGFARTGAWSHTIPVSVPDHLVPAAVNFILWFSQPEVQSRHSPVEPSNIAAWDIAPPWNTPMLREFMTAANNGKSLPGIGAWGEASRIIITELQNVLLRRKTPQQAGDDMVRLINPLL